MDPSLRRNRLVTHSLPEAARSRVHSPLVPKVVSRVPLAFTRATNDAPAGVPAGDDPPVRLHEDASERPAGPKNVRPSKPKVVSTAPEAVSRATTASFWVALGSTRPARTMEPSVCTAAA